MKVLPFEIPKPEGKALIYQEDKSAVFYSNLHRHEEIQLSIIISGEGDLIVADSIHRFGSGDVFILGSNVPHLFRSEEIEGQTSHMLTLFFTKKSFGINFFTLPELRELDSLFEKVALGIRLKENQLEIRGLFAQLDAASSLQRFILLLHVLKIVSDSKTEQLATYVFNRPYNQNEGTRMGDIVNYAMNTYSRDITLTEIASLASMTPNAFCRYFKRRTNKTFFQFLMEIRLEQACRLLVSEDDLSITNLSERCGFKNMSNFNRMFKRHTSKTPSGFRKSNRLI